MGQFLPKIRKVSSYLVASDIEKEPRKRKTNISSSIESIKAKRKPFDKNYKRSG